MALPASHLRFAIEVQQVFDIDSMRQFLSGTLYPDSRWLTGQDRGNTHGADCLETEFVVDDFTLGWHLHCRCDQIQIGLLEAVFPELARLEDNARWIRLSIAKMLQDREDMGQFDLDSALSALTHIRTPNGENPDRVDAYYQLVRNTYYGKTRLSMDDYRQLWIGVGLAEQTVTEIMRAVIQFSDNERFCAQCRQVYPGMVRRFLETEQKKPGID